MTTSSAPTERSPLLPPSQPNVNTNGSSRPRAASKTPSELSHLDPTNVPTRRKVLIFAPIWLAVFLGALDTTIVATLVGSISSDFGASNEASWLATSYVRLPASLLPISNSKV